MELKNQALNILVGAVLGVLLVGLLIVAVAFGIKIATAPLTAGLQDTGKLVVKVDSLSAQIESLNSEIKGLKQALSEMPAQPAQDPQQPPAEDFSKVYDIPVGDSYILGKPDAKITIVEVSDFQCPFCARFHPFVTEAIKAFPNDVKAMIKNFPLGFHPQARPAAKAALAAGLQGKYFEMVELLLANHAALSDEKYKELAGQVGINVEQFLKDLKDKDAEFEKKIEADMAVAGQIDVRGTPTYFLNGKKTNARSTEAWTSEIKALLQQ